MTFVHYAAAPRAKEEIREIWSETGAKIFANWYVSKHPEGVVLVYCKDAVLVYTGKTWLNWPKNSVVGVPLQDHLRGKGRSIQ